jgi:hypothetical protein
MIPAITPEQRRAIDEHHGQPIFVIDADRSQTFVLLSNADYDRVRNLLDDANGGSDDWTEEADARRCDLIDKDIAGTITPDEQAELAQLEHQAAKYFDATAAPPMERARQLHRELINRRDGRE